MMAEDSDEDLVSYGTCLEPIEDEAVRRKPVTLEDQIVTDKQGRRRFHGAFTGGFSAGYFNSVGTKEGWTPSTFVSSRGQRSEGQSRQRAEEFMDEEDLGDFGIAPRKIVTTDKFQDKVRAGKRLAPERGPSVIPGEHPLQDLIVPNTDTMGAKLLSKMGWRHGQGVGPKVRRRKKGVLTGTDQIPGDDDKELDDYLYKDFLFAPSDVEEIIMSAKDDYHGIGYRGLDPAMAGMGGHVKLFEEQPVYSRSGRRGIAGQAFGVGAFETADDDVYGVDNMANYDLVLGDFDPRGDNNYGWTAPKTHHKENAGVLENFKASSQRRPPNKVFPPPVLPRDFRPFHTMVKSSKENTPPTSSANMKGSRFSLSATQRGDMLGEEQLPGPTSVFDFLSPDDRDKLKTGASKEESILNEPLTRRFDQASSSTAGPSRFDQAPGSTATPSSTRLCNQAPGLPSASPTARDPQRLQALGEGYKPFGKDVGKQCRYEEYLANKKTGQGPGVSSTSDNLTEWERQREKEEFARASSLYQPLSGLMATRFVAAKNTDDDGTVEVPAEDGGDTSEQAKAAKLKMFGKLTRDSMEWHPDSLLCKRFNVPNPYPGSSIVGLPTVKKDKFSVFNFLTIPTAPADPAPVPTSRPDASHDQKSSRWDKGPGLLANVGVDDGSETKGLQETDGAEKETIVSSQKSDNEPEAESRLPMDLFKAIFASSSSSSSDEEDSEETSVANISGGDGEKHQMHKQGLDGTENGSATKSPSVDIDSMLVVSGASTEALTCHVSDKAKHKNLTSPAKSESDSEDVYGPCLPPSTATVTTITDYRPIADRGHDLQGQRSIKGSSRDSSGERRHSRSHRKEKRRKKHSKRSSSRHKHKKDKKKHKSKKKMQDHKKDNRVTQRGHRSTHSSEVKGHNRGVSEVDYDASGSSSSSSSDDDSN